jgi:hypothetical protein
MRMTSIISIYNEDDFYNKKKRALGKNKTAREVIAFAYYIHPLPTGGCTML